MFSFWLWRMRPCRSSCGKSKCFVY
ncbi:hypothetical protein OIU76_023159, partial [Salix suchowensis]